MNTPLPPVSGVDIDAAGPAGRGCVVDVTAGADVLVAEGLVVADGAALELLEHAARPNSATHATIVSRFITM
jgi:hypothetical protein